jgi:pyruvate/2-oxoglutarate dehydrogenase complex dihydrolipoamide acyltransferase (E2) component
LSDTALIEVQMPQMGESVTEGTILEWHVSEGQEIAEGDTVVEVSTDKIDAEVPAPSSGVVTKILAQVDDTVSVGQVLAEIDPNGSGNGAAPAAEEGPGLATAGTGEGDADIGESDPAELLDSAQGDSADDEVDVDTESESAGPGGETVVVAMPEMGESVTEGTVLEWRVAEGDSINEGDTVIEVSTDKIDAEVPAPASGTITKLLVQPDDVVKVGQPLAEMAAGGGAAAPAAPAGESSATPETAAPAPAAGDGRASPGGSRPSKASMWARSRARDQAAR